MSAAANVPVQAFVQLDRNWPRALPRSLAGMFVAPGGVGSIREGWYSN